MNEEKNTNYSLLSQDEIDTLVSFLVKSKDEIDSSVMNQEGIDKLIELIRSGATGISLGLVDPFITMKDDLLYTTGFRKEAAQTCELRMNFDEKQFVSLEVYNHATDQSMSLTTDMIYGKKSVEWGLCIPPYIFNRVARTLDLKYTMQQHEKVCSLFAKCVYGDDTQKLPDFYLPTNPQLVECIL